MQGVHGLAGRIPEKSGGQTSTENGADHSWGGWRFRPWGHCLDCSLSAASTEESLPTICTCHKYSGGIVLSKKGSNLLKVENVMTALRGKRGRLVDIGSGDGRIVLGWGD